MPSYESPGTENLRADYRSHAATPNASPSAAGTNAGGTANLGATTVTKSNPGKAMPSGTAKDVRPAGVQHFNGENL